jgi:DNA-binding transcriptional regulator LsrR (DeoR family)
MARLPRAPQGGLPDPRSLRIRAAWLYYAHGLTQKDVADRLGVARSTVIKLLDDAMKQGDVRIWIETGDDEGLRLGLELEQRFGFAEAIVVPSEPGTEETARAVGLALGRFLTERIDDGDIIGLGWGRTLTASLASFRPIRRRDCTVVSLLGGIVESHVANPMEVTWRIASALDARCYFFPAPLLVDGEETRRALIERCGLDRVTGLARSCSVVVLSVGDVGDDSTSLSTALIGPGAQAELAALGAVCDVMCNFLDAEGRTVDHPVNRRVMSAPLDAVAAAGHVVLAAGGARRARAILAAHRRFKVSTLVTDAAAAEALLAM